MSNDPDYEATQRERRAKRDAARAEAQQLTIPRTITGWAIAVDLTGGSDAATFLWHQSGNDLTHALYRTREDVDRVINQRKGWEKTTRWRNLRPVRVTITIEQPR